MRALGLWLMSVSPWIAVPVCGVILIVWAALGVGLFEFLAWVWERRR